LPNGLRPPRLRPVKTLLSIVLSWWIAPWALAASVSSDVLFEQLKGSGVDYRDSGSICEQVAKLDYEREYPAPDFRVLTGIEYSDSLRTIGELDVVIFKNKDQSPEEVVRVAEVKCWRNLGSAHRKATAQRERFEDTLKSGTPIRFRLAKQHGISFDPVLFRSNFGYNFISQLGGEGAGFDRTLAYDLDTLTALRLRLLACQEAGECKKPE
jgi:hypothetical protein